MTEDRLAALERELRYLRDRRQIVGRVVGSGYLRSSRYPSDPSYQRSRPTAASDGNVRNTQQSP